MARLLVNPGTSSEWVIPLKVGVNTLGRDAGCDFQIEHGSVSSRHCELAVNGDSVVVKDLGSTNGTFIDRAPATEASLTSGQRLQLGSVEMQFISDAPIVTAAPVVRLSIAGARGAAATAVSVPAETSMPSSPAAPQVRLRVAAHESTPVPPPGPAPMVADEYSVPVEGPAMCRYHPKSPAAWMCTQCQINFCDLCVASRPGGSRTGKFCRRCSAECVARQIQYVPEGLEKRNFFSQVGPAFAYPFKGSGTMFIVCGTIFFALVNFLGNYSIYLRIVYIGYMFAFMQRIVQTAAQGSDESASWPDISEFWSDIFVPFFQLLATVALCFGPAIGLTMWAGREYLSSGNMDLTKLLLIIPLGLVGAVYFPMALLSVAMFDTVAGLNPLVVVPAIFKVPLEYLVMMVLMAIILVLRWAGQYVLDLILPIPVVPQLIIAFIGLYFLTVQMRMLGLMYYAKRHKIGWFSRA